MQFDEAEMVSRVLQGDTDAFGRLVKHYQGAVYATAFYYAGRYGAAEDIAQEALLTAYRSLPRLRDPHRFGPWLKEIACRTSANWLRRNDKRLRLETPMPNPTIPLEDFRESPRRALERDERFEQVQKAIEALPERYRLPVVLRYLQELTYDEIADFTGESKEEVRGLLQRAGRQLRDALTDVNEAGEHNEWHRAQE